ncbi:hypothetical protein BU26DRAFT_161056 [Trematosphaeria pertusa]|uniref:Secreted protein n=1 Tax=Trematosphaeria pertusa TaxID=390896 RepID=A0A6A6HW61_9PLEO|nr:uncharacterized protein BU26DRAFT_161056 [Trematosphaeria pertusa]KAF2242425.1 hypothetical protein BU26DRAFT_161056 [Trematosphaeria pertusa]
MLSYLHHGSRFTRIAVLQLTVLRSASAFDAHPGHTHSVSVFSYIYLTSPTACTLAHTAVHLFGSLTLSIFSRFKRFQSYSNRYYSHLTKLRPFAPLSISGRKRLRVLLHSA